MSLVDHLGELRTRIFRSILAIAVGSVIGFYFATDVRNALVGLLPTGKVQVLGPGDAFMIQLRISIVIGIVPRYQEFIQPGPRITREQQPQLFDEIRRVAEATGSPMPREVYIVAQANAAVAHVGGWLGIGSRPIMMLGLPLIAVLRVSELRGVIAHEFGHFVGGETRLSTVIYRTREGIGRTIGTLERSVHWMSRGIRYPFIWYGEMYLRLTQAQSRRHRRNNPGGSRCGLC
jgi:Zn-dependent protease with chaperone function